MAEINYFESRDFSKRSQLNYRLPDIYNQLIYG